MNKQTMKTVKVSATGVQFGNAWFSHESITGYSAEQLNAGTCRIIGGQYMAWLSSEEDELSAVLAREAALREELAASNAAHEVAAQNHGALNTEIFNLQERLRDREDRYNREVLGLNNEGDLIGGDPAGGYKNDLTRANAAFDDLAACVGFSEARLDQTGDSPIDCANQLQQRLTVAEQRAGELEKALKFYADGDHLLLADPDAWDTCSGEPANFLHDEAGTASVEDGSIAKAALKPAAEVDHGKA